MARAAVIVEGVVTNILDVPADYAGPLPLVADTVQIGALEVGNALVNPAAPAPAAPAEISRVQLELWLDANGFAGGLQNAAILAAVAAAGGAAPIRMRSAQRFLIDDPLLVALAAALEISDLPAAFAAASQL